jgi:hypothetical protein
MSDQGVVYIATGDKFVEEATLSARTVREQMPNVPIALMTDLDTNIDVFDTTIEIEQPRHDFGDQVFHLGRTPYEKTIYLDTDIYLYESIEGLFTLLSNFDLAAAHNQRYYSSERVDIEGIAAIPRSFPEYNSGVVAMKRNDRVQSFLNEWRDAYEQVVEHGQVHNQAAFRLALYRSDVRLATIPPEYNCVFHRPGTVNRTVKVFHGRLSDIHGLGANEGMDIRQAMQEINSRSDLRSYYRIGNQISIAEPSLFRKGVSSVKQNGISATVAHAFSYVQRKLSF